MYGLSTERVNLNNQLERGEVEAFLQEFDLLLDQDVDYTIVIRDGVWNPAAKGTSIVATCSKAKSVLKCFAVAEELRGQGITAILVSALLDKLFSQGLYHSFVFTKPAKAHIFSALNFKLIHSTREVALLEHGLYDIHKALEQMKVNYNIGGAEKAALVMNCDPFTLGHYYLIEEAAKNNQEVLVFFLEEDRSLFPFKTRYEFVGKGVAHLKNVKVIPSGEYIISSATFPSYFIKEEGERLKAYAGLDAAIFGKYFCQSFNITKRYVGEEPYCKVAAAYNNALKKVLPPYGVEVIQIPRKSFGDFAISASWVRSLLKEGEFLNSIELKNLLPEREYTADELLDAREKRASLIDKLLKRYNTPLLVMRVNYPGLQKTNALTVNIIQEISPLICTSLSDKVRKTLLTYGADGPTFYVAVDEDVAALKTLAINFEESHSLGRCLDLDVYDRSGYSIRRQELGFPTRKCYLCEDYAHHCVRAKRHSEREVIEYLEEKFSRYLESSGYRRITPSGENG